MKHYLLTTILAWCFFPFNTPETNLQQNKKAETEISCYNNEIKLNSNQRIVISYTFNKKSSKTLKIKSYKLNESQIKDSTSLIKIPLRLRGSKDFIIDFNTMIFNGTDQTFLIINNPFNDTLIYKAKLYLPAANYYAETSVWPVKPNIPEIEHWKYPIEQILLYDFKLK
jgi:hypothetical protein